MLMPKYQMQVTAILIPQYKFLAFLFAKRSLGNVNCNGRCLGYILRALGDVRDVV